MMEIDIQNGHILIAEPFMQDAHFKKAVILICEHSIDNGTIGFVLNKKTDIKIEDVLSDFPECNASLYYGGPVGQDTIHFLHRCGDLIENSKEIMPGLFWGGDFEKLKFLMENKVITTLDVRFFIGYSGWSQGQLREELEIVSWILDDMDINYAFTAKPSALWQLTMHNKGNHFQVLADMSDQIGLN